MSRGEIEAVIEPETVEDIQPTASELIQIHIEEVKKKYDQGLTYWEIAEEMHLPYNHICGILSRLPRYKRKQAEKEREKRIPKIKQMLIDGATYFEIQQKYPVSGHVIKKCRKELGITQHISNKIYKRNKKICEYVKNHQDLTYSQIGKNLCISHKIIQRVCQENGITKKSARVVYNTAKDPKIRKLLIDGFTITYIKYELHCGDEAVHRQRDLLVKLGIKCRNRREEELDRKREELKKKYPNVKHPASAKWREENKEYDSLRNKKWHEENPERRRFLWNRWNQENKEYNIIRHKIYNKYHPEKVKKYSVEKTRKYRVKTLSAWRRFWNRIEK